MERQARGDLFELIGHDIFSEYASRISTAQDCAHRVLRLSSRGIAKTGWRKET